MITDIRSQLKNMSGRVNMNHFTQPYTTDAGVSFICRDAIVAFTTTEEEITVHLSSGTIFTIPISDDLDIEVITADLTGMQIKNDFSEGED